MLKPGPFRRFHVHNCVGFVVFVIFCSIRSLDFESGSNQRASTKISVTPGLNSELRRSTETLRGIKPLLLPNPWPFASIRGQNSDSVVYLGCG